MSISDPHNNCYNRALNRVIADGQFDVSEMASITDYSERHIYNCRDLSASLPLGPAARLARFLCEHGERRLSLCFVPTTYSLSPDALGRANGSSLDEVRDAVKAASDFDEGFEERNIDAMDSAISMLEEAVKNMRAERDHVAGTLS